MARALSLSQASISLNSSPSCSSIRISSHSSSSSSPSASQASALASQSSKTSSPSLYAAFKVLTLVNAFRKRVNISRKIQDKDKFCRDFERQAYEQIDRYLGRDSKGIRSTKSQARDIKVAAIVTESSEESIEGLLKNTDGTVNVAGNSLKTLATNERLFISRKSDFHIQHFNVKELLEIAVHVKDLLETLRRAAPPDRAFPPSKTDPALDLNYISNLEHLLLCLLQQLLSLFIADCLELVRGHIVECQKDHERYCEDWFFEYPDARHPLSTTWPWAIKPSLAVLWGVCWMFYDNDNYCLDKNMNLVDSMTGQIILYRQQLENLPDFSSFTVQNQFAAQHLMNQNLGSTRRPSRLPQNAGRGRVAQSNSPAHHSATSYTDNLGDYVSGPFQAPDLRGFSVPASNTFTQPPVTASTEDLLLPQAHQHQVSGLGYDNTYSTGQAENSWAHPSQPAATNHSYSQSQSSRAPQPENFDNARALPHHTGRRHLTPAIQLNIPTYTPEYSGQQPQESRVSSASSYHPHSAVTPTDPNYLSAQFPQLRHAYSSPVMATTEAQQPSEVPMRGPVSPNLEPIQRSLHGSPMQSPHPDQAHRKRSFSQISQNEPSLPQVLQAQMQPAHTPEHHDQNSYDPAHEPSPTFADDNFRQRSIKRPDPPMTADGKYWCNFANECSSLVFDRKCEWSKHMDKHDRPYRCPQPQCAKLQGFTYSGGLLRHEREVHGKHGGPKEQLRCTVPDCKRHTGKGFTRKENLNEHLRRVHGIITDGSQLRQMAADAVPGADAAETPISRFSDNHEMDDLTGISPTYPMPDKRRRLDHNTSPHSASDEVESELARLRAENLAKDERIHRVEQEHAETQQRLQNLETMLRQLTSNGLNKAEAEEQKMQRDG